MLDSWVPAVDADEMEMEDSTEVLKLCKIIGDKVEHYIYTPCGMASGFRGEAHKADCVVHTWHFDAPNCADLDEYH